MGKAEERAIKMREDILEALTDIDHLLPYTSWFIEQIREARAETFEEAAKWCRFMKLGGLKDPCGYDNGLEDAACNFDALAKGERGE